MRKNRNSNEIYEGIWKGNRTFYERNEELWDEIRSENVSMSNKKIIREYNWSKVQVFQRKYVEQSEEYEGI